MKQVKSNSSRRKLTVRSGWKSSGNESKSCKEDNKPQTLIKSMEKGSMILVSSLGIG